MAGRIRTIKPEWLEDELLAAAPDHVRILTVGLILMADDHGRGRASVNFVAGDVWRYDRSPEVLTKVREGLNWLSRIRFIRLYEIDGQSYFEIRTWQKHQKVQHVGKERVPPPPADSIIESQACELRESLTKVPEGFTPDLRPHTSDLIPPTWSAPTATPTAETNPEVVPESHGRASEPPLPPSPSSPSETLTAPPRRASNRGSRCPSSVDPEAVGWCERQRLPNPAQTPELRKMLDHFAAASGARGVKLDWAATWRNWAERAAEFGRGPARGPVRSIQPATPRTMMTLDEYVLSPANQGDF